VRPGFKLEDVKAGKYGQRLHFWDWKEKKIAQTIDLGAAGLIPLEVRFHHDPASTHGFVGAALLASGLLGMVDKLELEPAAQPPAEEDESKQKLPTTLEESLSNLEADDRITELLGEEFVKAYTVMRRYELQRFADHVTDWELQEYLEIY